MNALSASNYRVRRATVDDMAELGPLLQTTMLPASLEKRFTEFQVAEAPDGSLVGALGLQIAGKHGKIHGESYTDFGLVDILRPLLWQRIQTVAQTQGLIRLWTQETAPFWKQSDFGPVTPEVRQKMPAAFGDTKTDWLTLKLKEDVDDIASLDKEFAVFMEAEKARTQEIFAQARMVKGIAILFALGLFIFVIFGGFRILKQTGFFGGR